MTYPDILADRLEKAKAEVDKMPFGDAWKAARLSLGFLCVKELPAILAALRSSASAREVETKENEWNKLVHDFVGHAVNSYQWLSNAHTGIAKPGAADVISVHDDMHALMDRWVELRQRGTQFDRALAPPASPTTSPIEREVETIEPISISWGYQYNNFTTHGEWSRSYRYFHHSGAQPASRDAAFDYMVEISRGWRAGTKFRLVETVQTVVSDTVVAAPPASPTTLAEPEAEGA